MTTPAERPRTLLSIATYNERENLPLLLDDLLEVAPHADILVVDDNSPDGTGKIVDEYAARDPRVRAIHRPGKLGLGTGILAALQYAIDHDYDYVLNLDADFSHHPRDVPALLEGMKDHDVMIGSRYVPGGGVTGWNWRRKFMSWAINAYTRALLDVKARDCSGAYRCYRVSKLKEMDFSRIYSKGYSFQEEFLYRCQKVGCRIGETPIIFENRRHGESKINLREAGFALWAILYTAIRG